ncbi:MAE_28990/MAE_18760 family HEPN-like nuclease [Burkholderia sp. E168m22]|uniref:MAE_28990/MAE_18760 family HEPN-like nuclease n=3 Tax=unclassified Burkholderia TaxID=2613784 RepID=UPI0006D48669|nr:MAE_28990/MAE_18760 family HEPN-like nuclease [Burkholderia sp. E168m22]
MYSVRADFDKRCAEIKDYLDWLDDIESKDHGIPKGLPPTMKAAAMLLLYNLVESTMTNTVEAIFDELQAKKVAFDALSTCLKVAVLANIKNVAADKLTDKLIVITTDIIGCTFDKAKVFNGNVNSRKIREKLTEFGIKTTNSYKEERLNAIMIARNRLAHGAESFGDYGKDLTAGELIRDYERVSTLLTSVLNDVEEFLNQRHYLSGV